MTPALLLTLKLLGYGTAGSIATYYLTKLGKAATGTSGFKAVLLNAVLAAGVGATTTITGVNPLEPAGQAAPVPSPIDPTVLAGAAAAGIAMAGSNAGYQFWRERAVAGS